MKKGHERIAIVVKNCPGFLINRILLPYVNEAIYLMMQGFKIDDIDRIACKFGMPIGPLALADEFSATHLTKFVDRIKKRTSAKKTTKSSRNNTKKLDPFVDLLGPTGFQDNLY